MSEEKHVIEAQNAHKMYDWIKCRGGIAVWPSVDFSDLNRSWSTPVLDRDGNSNTKPTWKAADTPSRIITNVEDVVVSIDKEVKRFHVAIRMGAQGLQLKCTDASTRKINKAVETAGKGAFYRFDYSTQEAVIFAPEKQMSLMEYIFSHPADCDQTGHDFSGGDNAEPHCIKCGLCENQEGSR